VGLKWPNGPGKCFAGMTMVCFSHFRLLIWKRRKNEPVVFFLVVHIACHLPVVPRQESISFIAWFKESLSSLALDLPSVTDSNRRPGRGVKKGRGLKKT